MSFQEEASRPLCVAEISPWSAYVFPLLSFVLFCAFQLLTLAPVLQILLYSYGDSQQCRLDARHDQLQPSKAWSYVYDPTWQNGAYDMTNYVNVPTCIRS